MVYKFSRLFSLAKLRVILAFPDDLRIDSEWIIGKLGIEHQKLHSFTKRCIRYEYYEWLSRLR